MFDLKKGLEKLLEENQLNVLRFELELELLADYKKTAEPILQDRLTQEIETMQKRKEGVQKACGLLERRLEALKNLKK